jgi:6-pyruvoyltetrahydropterin/6-carboxytetrahydropterin synthase
MQTITRNGNFDSGHRVMNESMKCFNIHGHTYIYEATFAFEDTEDIGYAIDFKEIKRVFCQWIDDKLDHGMILNQHDVELISTTQNLGSKLWLMSLNGPNSYCNPSVENIAKEVFLAMDILSKTLYPNERIGLRAYKIRIYETPNCYTDCKRESIKLSERENFYTMRLTEIQEYALDKGVVQYDDRK